ncbi:rna exonuclease [Diaporthe amygdali]|uniref:rna exonuclease n=1 Tax=Phomopsis amygdali TaxID=1214568 RepID=UPI0022FF2D62|nr:rna exonuclease [Diaporthe amygdali]KAJ0108557.1 rna exonuclease [Diaporthe amygdali]
MEQLTSTTPRASYATSVSDQHKLPPDAPNFLPVEISDSGALILAPHQTKDVYMKQLQKLRQSQDTLQKAGYVMRPLTEDDLVQKRKCGRCHKLVFKNIFKRISDRKPNSGGETIEASANGQAPPGSATNPVAKAAQGGKLSENAPKREPQQVCKYHDGRFNGRIWTCCRSRPYDQPCKAATEHEPATYEPGELERLYRYYITPAVSPFSPMCHAVAIDCEMGTGMTHDSLCIRVSVIDYFTAEVLIDKLVFPDEPLLNYNTRFSGVTYGQMNRARSLGDCFFGIAEAREAIWQFVGPDTIVVAHSGQNDLTSLRWLHKNIVDTQLVESLPVMKLEKEAREKEAEEKMAREAEARQTQGDEPMDKAATGPKLEDVTNEGKSLTDLQKQTEKPKKKPKGSGRFSLKTLTKKRTGRDIQMGNDGHDSVVDAVATRDIAHWNVLNFGHGFYEIKNSDS